MKAKNHLKKVSRKGVTLFAFAGCCKIVTYKGGCRNRPNQSGGIETSSGERSPHTVIV